MRIIFFFVSFAFAPKPERMELQGRVCGCPNFFRITNHITAENGMTC
jgi:hypothetical protein